MSDPGESLAAAAEALVGTRFRPHGRTVAAGLDCVGVVLAAMAAAGRPAPAVPPYTLRNLSFAPFEAAMRDAGFMPLADAPRVGDLLVLAPSCGQLHLAIRLADGDIVHAHAGLRRTVRSPAPPKEQIHRRFRLT